MKSKKERTVRMHIRAIPSKSRPHHTVETVDMTRRRYLAFWRKEYKRCDFTYDREVHIAAFETLFKAQNERKP